MASLQSAVGSQMRMVDSLVEVNVAQARMDVAPVRIIVVQLGLIVSKEIPVCARIPVVLEMALAPRGKHVLEQVLAINTKLRVV